MLNTENKYNIIEQVKKYIKEELSEEEMENMTKDMFKTYFEEEDLKLKTKWKKILEQDEEVSTLEVSRKKVLNTDTLPSSQRTTFSSVDKWRFLKYSSIAASLLIVIGCWFLLQSNVDSLATSSLADSSYETQAKRGNKNLQLGEKYFNNQDYQKAEEQALLALQQTNSTQTNFAKTQYFLGHIYLKQEDWSKAVDAFIVVTNHRSGDQKEEATWYAGLAAIKNNDFELAKKQLKEVVRRDGWKKNAAAELIKKISE